MTPTILSVIVPVYNVEKYLSRCIDSILSQTFSNFELILVDDGSTDNSSKVCDEYAKIDDRVHVFHRENGGVSSARNWGLRQAIGEYVTFLDSDDAICKDTFRENINILLNNKNIDILQYPYSRITENNTEIEYRVESPITYLDKMDIFLNLVYNGPITWTSWGKFYKKNIYKFLCFHEGMCVNEDLYALVNIIAYINCMYISNLGRYLYYYRNDSVCSGSYSPLKSLDYSRTKMLIFKTSLKYGVDAVPFWNDAVKSCIDSWSYYGPCDELKGFLKELRLFTLGMKSKSRSNRMVRLSRIFTPLIAARIKFVMVRILHLNKY